MFDFPNSPTTGQTVSNGSATYRFDGTKWGVAGAAAGVTTWNGRAGVVTMTAADITGAGGAPAAALNNTGRNLLQNSQFSVQQRGTGVWTTSGAYTADRWFTQFLNDTVSISIASLVNADRSQIGDEIAQNCIRVTFTGSSTAGAYNQLVQGIENVRRLSNKTVTVSAWMKATSGTPSVGIYIGQNFGAGGSPSPTAYTTLGATPALSTAWQRYSFTAALPSSSSKTFGTTAGTDMSLLYFVLSDQGNTSGTGIGVQSGAVSIWGVQLEVGSVVTPLDYGGSPADQLRQCQRYYQIGSQSYSNPAATVVNAWGFNSPFMLPVPMRAIPTMAVTGTPTYTNCSGASFVAPSQNNAYLLATTTGTTGGVACVASFSASADL